MSRDSDDAQAELARIQSTIGRREVARVLFKPRVERNVIDDFTSLIIRRLRAEPKSVGLLCDFDRMPDDGVGPWATRLWTNVISELAAGNEGLRTLVTTGHGYVPRDPAVIALYRRCVAEGFHFFLWLYGWGGERGDTSNCFTARLVALEHAIVIEDLKATRNGQPGGWGLLDAVVEGARPFAVGGGYVLKTVATNPRVLSAFRKRGFVASTAATSMIHSAAATPLELRLAQE